jgi:pimeloyl-ACP methyl ester carboxylesterase
MKQHFEYHKMFLPHYDAHNGIKQNVDMLYDQIQYKSNGSPVTVIGHSLGGLMSVLLYHKGLKINKLVGISSPLGGFEASSILKYWAPTNKLINDLNPKNDFYHKIKTTPILVDNMFFVTKSGTNSIFGDENDGVLTVRSQSAIPNLNYVNVELNHSEVLLCDDVIKKLNAFIK